VSSTARESIIARPSKAALNPKRITAAIQDGRNPHLLADDRVVDRKRKTLREKPLEAVGCFVDARKLGERVDICEKAL